ncbi:helix-turn-helix domain-containing protein [Flavobacterium sp.]|jgi:plasmid maintenance system antidote protein VapI|uniref:helix-turn-helix transcriptional regulator n=1 Tax=Flavobacterium sp. TaxID=239 RepID=UPI001B641427|nr:helix-turn-helix domain-containing protein [Flavobacterium sp.]MBP6127992.1 plasmid maintenance system antidote protein [Flavobacterium sp.]
MKTYLEKYKGIHPGIILDREFKKRALQQRPFALSIGEYPQTLNAITKGKRKLNTALALKIEEKLGLEEGTLALLQTYFDINEEKSKLKQSSPNLSKLRKSLFWDTDINKIDWSKQYRAVIQRIFERGNESERNEVIRFYGQEKIKNALNQNHLPYTIYNK